MSLPWVALPTAAILGSTRTHVYEAPPPRWVMVAEVRAICVAGELPAWSQRQFGKRWGVSTKVVRSVLVAAMRGTAEEPELARVGTAITERFPALAGAFEPPRNRRGTAEEPSRARSFLEKKKERETKSSSLSSISDQNWTRFAAAYASWSSGTLDRKVWSPKVDSLVKALGEQGLVVWEWICSDKSSATAWARQNLKGSKLPAAYLRKNREYALTVQGEYEQAQQKPEPPTLVEPEPEERRPATFHDLGRGAWNIALTHYDANEYAWEDEIREMHAQGRRLPGHVLYDLGLRRPKAQEANNGQ